MQNELLNAVSTDFRDELRRIIGGGMLARHMGALLQSVRHGTIGDLLKYGIDHLPGSESRPDDALAAFFTVLSELRDCPHEVRIFATKCMEYCESEALDGWSESLADLKDAYKDLSH
jgi:hypothetical protein